MSNESAADVLRGVLDVTAFPRLYRTDVYIGKGIVGNVLSLRNNERAVV